MRMMRKFIKSFVRQDAAPTSRKDEEPNAHPSALMTDRFATTKSQIGHFLRGFEKKIRYSGTAESHPVLRLIRDSCKKEQTSVNNAIRHLDSLKDIKRNYGRAILYLHETAPCANPWRHHRLGKNKLEEKAQALDCILSDMYRDEDLRGRVGSPVRVFYTPDARQRLAVARGDENIIRMADLEIKIGGDAEVVAMLETARRLFFAWTRPSAMRSSNHFENARSFMAR